MSYKFLNDTTELLKDGSPQRILRTIRIQENHRRNKKRVVEFLTALRCQIDVIQAIGKNSCIFVIMDRNGHDKSIAIFPESVVILDPHAGRFAVITNKTERDHPKKIFLMETAALRDVIAILVNTPAHSG